MKFTIRPASVDDAQAIVDIYGPYVLHTAITFEYVVPSVEEFRSRMEGIIGRYPYLVAETEDGEIVGYSYASLFHKRAAFSRCVETTIYIKLGHHGQGIGKALYTRLEDELREQGILNANASIAWIDEPNEFLTHDSPKFHEHFGYTRCALFHKCGWKFGQWFDMIWMEKFLGPHNI